MYTVCPKLDIWQDVKQKHFLRNENSTVYLNTFTSTNAQNVVHLLLLFGITHSSS